MRIQVCEQNNDKIFQNFVMSHPKSLIYHTVQYKELIKKQLKCDLEYYLLLNNDRVEAILTAMSKIGRFGRVFNALPFFGSNGGILANNTAAYGAMVECYNNLIEGASFSTFIENPFDINKQKPIFDLSSQRVCQFTDTSKIDLEDLTTIFTSKKRNDIRRALRHDLDVYIDCSDRAKQFLINTHTENMLAIGAASKSEQYFHDLFSIFRAGTDYEIFVARKNGQSIAALLVLYHKNIIEYYVPVILRQHRGLQALSLIIYEAMRQNKPKGRTIWNWGGNGASLDSVYRFKKSWGAVDLPYRYFTKINKEYPLSLDPNKLLSDYAGFYLYPFEQCQDAA